MCSAPLPWGKSTNAPLSLLSLQCCLVAVGCSSGCFLGGRVVLDWTLNYSKSGHENVTQNVTAAAMLCKSEKQTLQHSHFPIVISSL